MGSLKDRGIKITGTTNFNVAIVKEGIGKMPNKMGFKLEKTREGSLWPNQKPK